MRIIRDKRITEYRSEYTKLCGELERVTVKIALATSASHILHDYFIESRDIVHRLLKHISEELDSGTEQQAYRSIREAQFLVSFLSEEIKLVGINDLKSWKVIDVSNFGLKGDGQFDNGPGLQNLLTNFCGGFCRLLFPEGRYCFSNEADCSAIELKKFSNVSFEGQGDVRFLFDKKARAQHNLQIQECHNLTFSNLTFDDDPTPYTMGKLVNIINGNEIEIEICPEHPLPDDSYLSAKFLRGLVHEPLTGDICKDCGDPRVIELEQVGVRSYRLKLDDNALSGETKMTGSFSLGKLFSLHPRQRPSFGSCVFIQASEHLLFSRVLMRSSDDMMCRISSSGGVKFVDCTLEPEPGRFVLNNADGFHCRSNHKGIYLERCRVFSTNDDCLNFYSGLANVGEVEQGKRFTVLCTRESNTARANFRVGDLIGFLNPNDGEFDGFTTIEDIEYIEWGGEKERIRLVTADRIGNIFGRRDVGRADIFLAREYTPSGGEDYRMAMAHDGAFEHMILNLSMKNDGFIIRNCEMGKNRSNGFKVKATNGVMRNVHFKEQNMVFEAEPNWREGTYPRNILLENVIVDRGITYQASLPRARKLKGKSVAKFMTHIEFENCFDENGKALLPPI